MNTPDLNRGIGQYRNIVKSSYLEDRPNDYAGARKYWRSFKNDDWDDKELGPIFRQSGLDAITKANGAEYTENQYQQDRIKNNTFNTSLLNMGMGTLTSVVDPMFRNALADRTYDAKTKDIDETIYGFNNDPLMNMFRKKDDVTKAVNNRTLGVFDNYQDIALNDELDSNLLNHKSSNNKSHALATLNAAGKGAATGAMLGGGWGALAGVITGLGAGITNWIRGDKLTKQYNEEAERQNKYNRDAYNTMISNINFNNYADQMRMVAFGGQLFANGGNLHSNGADWSNGITEFNTGGSHEENPLGGIQQGIAPDGKRNLVEQGEVKWKDYVFSKQLYMDEILANRTGMKKYANKDFASIAKKIGEESKERPNDPISSRGRDILLERLAGIQEEVKRREQEKELKKQIDNMTPEQLQQMQQMVARQQDSEYLDEQELYNQLMAEDEEVYAQADAEQQAMLEQQMLEQQGGIPTPMMELGGSLHYANGGHLFSGTSPDYNSFLTYYDANNENNRKLAEYLAGVEGYRRDWYDPLNGDNKNTIGLGLDGTTGLSEEQVKQINEALTKAKENNDYADFDAIIGGIVTNKLNTITDKYKNLIGADNWDKLRDDQKWGLLSYAYNIGMGNVEKHPKLIQALKDENYEEAALQMNANMDSNNSDSYMPYLMNRRNKDAQMVSGDKSRIYFTQSNPATFTPISNSTAPLNQNVTSIQGTVAPRTPKDGYWYQSEIDANGNPQYKYYDTKEALLAAYPEAQYLNTSSGTNGISELSLPDGFDWRDDTDWTNYFYGPKPAEVSDPKGTQDSVPLGNSWLRFAPILGGLQGLVMASRPEDYSNLEPVRRAMNRRISFNPIGNYLTLKKEDRQAYINRGQAANAMNYQNALDMANGSRGLATAAANAALYTGETAINDVGLKIDALNAEKRKAVFEGNQKTDMFNSQGFLDADTQNLANQRELAPVYSNGREAISSARAGAIMGNLGNVYQSLGDIGREIALANLINQNKNNRYVVDALTQQVTKKG